MSINSRSNILQILIVMLLVPIILIVAVRSQKTLPDVMGSLSRNFETAQLIASESGSGPLLRAVEMNYRLPHYDNWWITYIFQDNSGKTMFVYCTETGCGSEQGSETSIYCDPFELIDVKLDMRSIAGGISDSGFGTILNTERGLIQLHLEKEYHGCIDDPVWEISIYSAQTDPAQFIRLFLNGKSGELIQIGVY